MENTLEPLETLDYCPANTPYLIAKNREEKQTWILKARCKKWDCEYCGEVNRFQTWIRIVQGAEKLLQEGQELYFLTLTCHESFKTLEGTIKNWRSGWAKLQTRIRRAMKEKKVINDLVYVYVAEQHKSGRLHIHILSNCPLSTRWFKDNARQCGLGHQAKNVKLDNALQGVNYVTKYLAKDMRTHKYPKGFRRVSYSRNFPRKNDTKSNIEFQVLDYRMPLIQAIFTAWEVDNHDVYLNRKLLEYIDVYDMID